MKPLRVFSVISTVVLTSTLISRVQNLGKSYLSTVNGLYDCSWQWLKTINLSVHTSINRYFREHMLKYEWKRVETFPLLEAMHVIIDRIDVSTWFLMSSFYGLYHKEGRRWTLVFLPWARGVVEHFTCYVEFHWWYWVYFSRREWTAILNERETEIGNLECRVAFRVYRYCIINLSSTQIAKLNSVVCRETFLSCERLSKDLLL